MINDKYKKGLRSVMKSKNIIKQRILTSGAFFLISLVSVFFSGCTARKQEPISRTGFYFDTVISITVYSSEDEKCLDGCFALAEYYEGLLSRTKEGSDIYKINHAAGEEVLVSPETLELLETALEYAKLTKGKIDPTIGSVSELWDFHPEAAPMLPDPENLRTALSHVDYQKIEISENMVTLSDPEAVLDLGFIAKGYIADKIKEYLRTEGVSSAIINLGGNVLTLGSRPDNTPYVIGIQEPFGDTGAYVTTLSVRDRSVVSSGIYERCFTYDGKLYHHILDTSTGYPIENDLLAVTILSDSSMEGDALSTICFTLGFHEAFAYIETLPDVDALFITSDGEIHKTY